MSKKESIHEYIRLICSDVLEFIKELEPHYSDRWVPQTEIVKKLSLEFVAVPKANKQYGEKGWFFAIIARLLEDQELVEYRKADRRAYYRSKS